MFFKKLFSAVGITALLALSITACKKDHAPFGQDASELAGQSSANPGTTTRSITFVPKLNLAACLGYDIQVIGQAVEILEKTVSVSGLVHYTRHWRVKGLTATSVGAPTIKHFNIVAGAEMFSVIDPNTTTGLPVAALSGDVFIHQGTMVLVNRDTGEKIVARHQILKNPALGIHRSGWFINGQKCGA